MFIKPQFFQSLLKEIGNGRWILEKFRGREDEYDQYTLYVLYNIKKYKL